MTACSRPSQSSPSSRAFMRASSRARSAIRSTTSSRSESTSASSATHWYAGVEGDRPLLGALAGHDREFADRLDVAGQQAEDHQPVGEAGLQHDPAAAVGHAQLAGRAAGDQPGGQRVAGAGGLVLERDEPQAQRAIARLDADGGERVGLDESLAQRVVQPRDDRRSAPTGPSTDSTRR